MDLGVGRANGSVTLDVSDDGAGFDPTEAFPGHLGLRSTRERAESLVGTLQIESAPGEGTRIRVSISPSPAEVYGRSPAQGPPDARGGFFSRRPKTRGPALG